MPILIKLGLFFKIAFALSTKPLLIPFSIGFNNQCAKGTVINNVNGVSATIENLKNGINMLDKVIKPNDTIKFNINNTNILRFIRLVILSGVFFGA